MQRHWRRRGAWTPQDWMLDLAVFHQGRPIGVQEMWAKNFATLREVGTASWLGLEHQGQGLGSEMRSAMLHLAFGGLGAAEATTASFTDNPAPLGVSRKLGYRQDGIMRDVLHGQVVVSQRLRLTRPEWAATDGPAVTISGLEACRAQFGFVESEPG